jgi:hypothetical protein
MVVGRILESKPIAKKDFDSMAVAKFAPEEVPEPFWNNPLTGPVVRS